MPLKKPEDSKFASLDQLDILKIFKTPDFPINFANKKLGGDNWTALHDAIAKQNEAEVDRLLSSSDVDGGTREHGWSPAHVAAQVGNLSIAKKVFAKSGMHGNKNGWNPFHMAVVSGNIDVIKAAAQALKLPKDGGNNDGFNVLHVASYFCGKEVVKHICDTYPILMKIGNSKGWHSGHIACAKGNVDALECLMTYNIVGDGNQDSWWRAANVAAYYGNLECMKLLKDPWDGNRDNTRSVHVAVMSDIKGNHLEEVQYCVETLKQSKDTADLLGATPFNLAVYGAHAEILAYFLAGDRELAREVVGASNVPQVSIEVALNCIGDDALDVA